MVGGVGLRGAKKIEEWLQRVAIAAVFSGEPGWNKRWVGGRLTMAFGALFICRGLVLTCFSAWMMSAAGGADAPRQL